MKNTIIKVKTFLTDGTASREMEINPESAFNAWGVTDFRNFLKIADKSDSIADTAARQEMTDFFYCHITEWVDRFITENRGKNAECFKALFSGDFATMQKFVKPKKIISDFRKAVRFLEILSDEKYSDFIAWRNERKQQEMPETETWENVKFEDIPDLPNPELMSEEITAHENLKDQL